MEVWLDCSLVRWATSCCQLGFFLLPLFFFEYVEGGWGKAWIAAPSCLHEYCSHQQDGSAARLLPRFHRPVIQKLTKNKTNHERASHAEEQISLLKLNERRLLFYNLCNLQLSGLLGVWWAGQTVRVEVMWAWRSLPSLQLRYSWRRGNRGAVNKSRPGLIIAVTLARARTHTHSHTQTSGSHRGKDLIFSYFSLC